MKRTKKANTASVEVERKRRENLANAYTTVLEMLQHEGLLSIDLREMALREMLLSDKLRRDAGRTKQEPAHSALIEMARDALADGFGALLQYALDGAESAPAAAQRIEAALRDYNLGKSDCRMPRTRKAALEVIGRFLRDKGRLPTARELDQEIGRRATAAHQALVDVRRAAKLEDFDHRRRGWFPRK